MSNDPNRLNFDPIPVNGTARPELPKVPDLPLQKALAAAKAQPTPAETPSPIVPATPPFSVWSIFEPTRTKGVIAAGIMSLLGGAATMKYIWPPKAPTPMAQAEPEPSAPLPPLSPTNKPETFATIPPVVPVSLTPIVPAPIVPAPTVPIATLPMPAVTVPVVSSLPAVTLPPLMTAPVAASPPPVPAATSSTGTSIPFPLPDLIRTGGSDSTVPTVPVPVAKPADKPIDLRLPELAPTGGTTPATPTAIALPSLTATPAAPAASPVPAATPALLPLPEVKVDLPGVTSVPVAKVEPPTLTALPVPGATVPLAKPLEIGVPPLVETSVPMPKLEFATPLPESKTAAPELPVISVLPTATKPELKPAAPELPAVSVLPVAAKPQPAPTNAKTEYDVDLHYVKSGDTWAAISKLHFGDERYADALKGYNQNASLAQLQRAEVPPIHVLRKNFATLIGRPVEKGNEWGSITPSSATLASNDSKRSVTGNGYKIYSVPAGGKTLKEIAADAYGDEGRWGMVWDTNPKLVPDKPVPEGTKIYLTSQAKIGD